MEIDFFIKFIGMIACLTFLLMKCHIVRNRILKIFLGILAIIFYLLIWIIFSVAFQPLSALMSVILPIIVIWLLIKKSPPALKIVVLSIFIFCTLYCTIYNSIPGPIQFLITDRPIDVPSQWFCCYRFFWLGCVLYESIWLATLPSIIVIAFAFLTDKANGNSINAQE